MPQHTSQTVEKMAARSQSLTEAITRTGAGMAESIAARAEEANANAALHRPSAGRATFRSAAARWSPRWSRPPRASAKPWPRAATSSPTLSARAPRRWSPPSTTAAKRSKTCWRRAWQAFEDVFQHGGTELTEKVARDTSTLGNLITRQLAEFDRTVKTYGGELVERLGNAHAGRGRGHAQLHRHLRPARQRPLRRILERARSSASRTSSTLLGSRVSGPVRSHHHRRRRHCRRARQAHERDHRRHRYRAATTSPRPSAPKPAKSTARSARRAQEVADHLDSRIGRFEELLVGRAETVTTQIETRTKAAADALNARMEELSEIIKVNTAEAERSLGTARDRHQRRHPRCRPAKPSARSPASATRSPAAFIGKADEIAGAAHPPRRRR